MADNRPVSGDQGQTGPDKDGAPQAQQEVTRSETPPAFDVDTENKEALFASAQIYTVPANPDSEDADAFNEWQQKVNAVQEKK